jgi:hypothetical protein
VAEKLPARDSDPLTRGSIAYLEGDFLPPRGKLAMSKKVSARAKLIRNLVRAHIPVQDGMVLKADIAKFLKSLAKKATAAVKQIDEYSLDSYGFEASDYFPGAGTNGYDAVYVGVGETERAAYFDALDQLGSDFDTDAVSFPDEEKFDATDVSYLDIEVSGVLDGKKLKSAQTYTSVEYGTPSSNEFSQDGDKVSVRVRDTNEEDALHEIEKLLEDNGVENVNEVMGNVVIDASLDDVNYHFVIRVKGKGEEATSSVNIQEYDWVIAADAKAEYKIEVDAASLKRAGFDGQAKTVRFALIGSFTQDEEAVGLVFNMKDLGTNPNDDRLSLGVPNPELGTPETARKVWDNAKYALDNAETLTYERVCQILAGFGFKQVHKLY